MKRVGGNTNAVSPKSHTTEQARNYRRTKLIHKARDDTMEMLIYCNQYVKKSDIIMSNFRITKRSW